MKKKTILFILAMISGFFATSQVMAKAPFDTDPLEEGGRTNQRKSINKKVLWGSVASIAAICLGGGWYYYNKRNTEKNEGAIARTLAIIKPNALNKSDEIMKEILDAGFTIIKSNKVALEEEVASYFHKKHKSDSFFKKSIKKITSKPVWVMILERQNAVKAWQNMINPKDITKEPQQSLHEKDETNITPNTVYGSKNEKTAEKEIGFFFDD